MAMKLKKKSEVVEKQVEEQVEEQVVEQVEEEQPTKPDRKNLSDIIDKTRPFYIIYSGVEQEEYFNVLYDEGIRNFLISFHYVQNKHLSMEKQYGGKGVKFFVDSGAHTYMQDPKYQDLEVEYWEEHLKKYLKWAEKNKEFIFAIASFDFEAIVGAETVKRWNEQYFEPFMLRTGIPVCFVWHQVSYCDWEHYCQRYPYVGFSSVNIESNTDIDLNEYTNKLRIAEKYNAVVHGFGMTRTSMLTKLSFYTADSTTWLVGLQYGEINFWNGQKMQRLKKDKWKGAYLEIICDKYDLDSSLLEAEDTTEMIRANVGAFIEAEAYIQSQAKARFYWQKPKKQIRTSTDGVDFPSVDWLLGETDFEDIEKYCKELNITTEGDADELIGYVTDVTLFANRWNGEYKETFESTYNEETIKELHDTWINRLVETEDERVDDLIEFYTNVVLGTEDKLLYIGTNFDRTVLEREDKDYITDEEYDYVDVPDIDVKNLMAKYLPKKAEDDDGTAPEVDELDDEIFEMNGIVPVRDKHGKFLKGQKKVLKPKQLNSKKFPKLACDTCFNAQKCPQYKAGYVCAFNKMFQRYDTRDMADIIQAMQGIASYSIERLQRGIITETLEGGLPDPNVTSMMNQSMELMSQLQKMYEYGSQEVLKQTKVIRADGSTEMTTQVSNPQSGGILEKIFGGMGQEEVKEEPNKEETKEVEATVVRSETK